MPLKKKNVVSEEKKTKEKPVVQGTEASVNKEEVERLLEQAKSGYAQDAVTKFFDAVMRFAYAQRASDVHLEPEEGK
ncbi:hypothetical protein HYV72_02490, partial [Candidatus Uhrbacteria bacterium]|nr:hypothetical protein [Candidatus Uhrbacteria bacterium]